MMGAKKPQVSPKAPFENISETMETPDIAAFRAFNPSTTMLQPALKARFDASRRDIRDSYGAYSGIPSQVARNRLRDEALREADEGEAVALAEGDERVQALKMAQLEALAGLTTKRKQSGFNTQVVQPQPSTFIPSLLGGIFSGVSGALSARSPSVPKPKAPTYFPSSRTWP